MDAAIRDAIKDLQAEVLVNRTAFNALVSVLVATGSFGETWIGTIDRTVLNAIDMVEYRDEARKAAERELHADFIARLRNLLPENQ